MRWSDVTFEAPPRVLRQFAGLSLVLFGGWGAMCLVGGRTTAGVVLLAFAAIVGVVGLVRPRAIRHVFGAAMLVAFPIGWTVAQILLLILFFAVFAPLGILFRIIGRDSLRRPFVAAAETYWEPVPETSDPRRYLRQF
jgi:hypothetical protein